MFERRVEKSVDWITTESANDAETEVCEDFHERAISDGPVNLRKLLDPRHVEVRNNFLSIPSLILMYILQTHKFYPIN